MLRKATWFERLFNKNIYVVTNEKVKLEEFREKDRKIKEALDYINTIKRKKQCQK